MNTSDILKDPTAKWEREPPADSIAVQRLVAESKAELPEDYIALLYYSNGGERELGVEPGWFQLWPAEKVIEFNQGYEAETNVPGFFGFGSNGGGEMLAFDMRSGEPWKIVMIPFIPMQVKNAIVIADDFGAFLQSMGREFGG
jgi:hypothetical protein